MMSAVMWVLCFTLISVYQNEINKLEQPTNCVKVYRKFYQCGSLSQAFKLLETCSDSTDVIIESGNSLNVFFTNYII